MGSVALQLCGFFRRKRVGARAVPKYSKDGERVDSTTQREVTPINTDPGEWPLYRLVVEKICTWTELDTRLSIDDVANLNEALDIKLAFAGQIELYEA